MSTKDKYEQTRLPMVPIRDVVIFPFMMVPFVIGRESSVNALEAALRGDKRIFLATQHDALSRRRYAALRQRGHSHGRALRTVADRLLSVACTLLEQQTLFDPTYEVREAAGA